MAVTVPAIDLDHRTRARLTRLLRQEAADKVEAVHAGELAAEARMSIRRADRVSAAVARLQPLISKLENHLRAELRDAMRQGDNNRRLRVEREIDELFALADQAAQEAGR
jgi:hypothetical protein